MNGDLSEKLSQVLSNPAMMAQIKALADTMTEQSDHAPKPEEAPQPLPFSAVTNEPVHASPEKTELPAFLHPSSAFERNMKNTCALLTALKPFLDERRCEKIDKMLSMIRFAEMAGKLGSFF